MASAAVLKMAAAVCILAMCIGSQMVIAAGASQDAAAGALLRELMEHELAAEMGLAAAGALLRELMEHELAAEMCLAAADDDSVGDVCMPACQTCLIVCAIKCVLKPNPAACYADCIVADKCFTLKIATA